MTGGRRGLRRNQLNLSQQLPALTAFTAGAGAASVTSAATALALAPAVAGGVGSAVGGVAASLHGTGAVDSDLEGDPAFEDGANAVVLSSDAAALRMSLTLGGLGAAAQSLGPGGRLSLKPASAATAAAAGIVINASPQQQQQLANGSGVLPLLSSGVLGNGGSGNSASSSAASSRRNMSSVLPPLGYKTKSKRSDGDGIARLITTPPVVAAVANSKGGAAKKAVPVQRRDFDDDEDDDGDTADEMTRLGLGPSLVPRKNIGSTTAAGGASQSRLILTPPNKKSQPQLQLQPQARPQAQFTAVAAAAPGTAAAEVAAFMSGRRLNFRDLHGHSWSGAEGEGDEVLLEERRAQAAVDSAIAAATAKSTANASLTSTSSSASSSASASKSAKKSSNMASGDVISGPALVAGTTMNGGFGKVTVSGQNSSNNGLRGFNLYDMDADLAPQGGKKNKWKN